MANDPSSVDWILQHSHRYPLLTADEEIQLSRQVQAWLPLREKNKLTKREQAIAKRGRRAFDRFFHCNIRLVVQVAGKYTRVAGSLTHEDLIQEGMLGLERAIVKFDHTRGYKFSTYAFNWVRQSIFRAISNKARVIRLPCSAFLTMKHARAYMEQVKHETGSLPTMEEVAAHFNVRAHTLKAYFRHDGMTVSLDSTISLPTDDGNTYLELLADPRSTEDPLDDMSDQAAAIEPILQELDPTEQHILRRRYFHGNDRGTSYSQIASEIGISRQGVIDRHNRSLNKLRYKLKHQPAAIPAPDPWAATAA